MSSITLINVKHFKNNPIQETQFDKTDALSQEEKLLQSTACEAVREMGFSEDDIKVAIKIYTKRHNGIFCFGIKLQQTNLLLNLL